MDPFPRRQLPQQSPPSSACALLFHLLFPCLHPSLSLWSPHPAPTHWTVDAVRATVLRQAPVSYECEKGPRVEILGLDLKKTRLRPSQKTKGLRRVAPPPSEGSCKYYDWIRDLKHNLCTRGSALGLDTHHYTRQSM